LAALAQIVGVEHFVDSIAFWMTWPPRAMITTSTPRRAQRDELDPVETRRLRGPAATRTRHAATPCDTTCDTWESRTSRSAPELSRRSRASTALAVRRERFDSSSRST